MAVNLVSSTSVYTRGFSDSLFTVIPVVNIIKLNKQYNDAISNINADIAEVNRNEYQTAIIKRKIGDLSGFVGFVIDHGLVHNIITFLALSILTFLVVTLFPAIQIPIVIGFTLYGINELVWVASGLNIIGKCQKDQKRLYEQLEQLK